VKRPFEFVFISNVAFKAVGIHIKPLLDGNARGAIRRKIISDTFNTKKLLNHAD